MEFPARMAFSAVPLIRFSDLVNPFVELLPLGGLLFRLGGLVFFNDLDGSVVVSGEGRLESLVAW